MFDQSDVIYAYTRQDALQDGVLVNVSEKYPEECALYKYPVDFTQRLWGTVEKAVANKRHMNDFKGVLWDIIYMSVNSGMYLNQATKVFKVTITGAGRQRLFELKAVVGPSGPDDPSPVVTFMHRDED